VLLLERVRTDPRFAFDPKKAPDLIDERLLAVGAFTGFGEVIDWLDERCTIADIARAGGVLYGATGDFTALHTVTAAQAVTVLLPYVEAPKVLLPWLWQGLAAAYIAIGRPALPDADTITAWRAADTPAWPALLSNALAEDDEHTVKLCYAALSLGRLTGDRLFRWLAAREVGALKSVDLPAWRKN
jgi:hypothetical protein